MNPQDIEDPSYGINMFRLFKQASKLVMLNNLNAETYNYPDTSGLTFSSSF